jgi:hypothetical protein
LFASRVAVCAAGGPLLAFLTACSGSSHPATTATHNSARHAPASAQLTVGQARSIFATFLAKFEQLASNPSQVSQLTVGPETAIETFLHGNAGPAPGTLTGERFLVPYRIGYPRWFLAAGSASDQQGFLFVMVQQSAGAPWGDAAELYDLSLPPQILSDMSLAGFKASGYANPVLPGDVSLTTEPSALSGAYAQYLNQGGWGPQRRSFLPGGYTTGYLQSNRQTAANAETHGWRFADTYSAVNLPVYGLEFPSGAGALVIFYARETMSWTATSSSASTSETASAAGEAPPPQFLHQLGITAARPGLQVTANAIDENLAYVLPAGDQGVTIVVNDGKAVRIAKSSQP